MTERKHVEGDLDCFFGNADGRGLTRIEVHGTGEHVASMPRGSVSEATALEICRRWNAHTDLLAACIALSKRMPKRGECYRSGIGGSGALTNYDPEVEDMFAAIDKATGAA